MKIIECYEENTNSLLDNINGDLCLKIITLFLIYKFRELFIIYTDNETVIIL